VGTGSATDPVHIADAAPTTIDDAGIQSWLTMQLATASGFPAADDQSLYLIFYPEATTVTKATNDQLCDQFRGYHSSFQLASGQNVAYAVAGRCSNSAHITLDTVTQVASHEMIEAATDPFPRSVPAYYTPPLADYAWTQTNEGGEVGDLCEHDSSSDYRDSEVGYLVQRTWSNAEAAAGHDPCVPHADGDFFFGAAPMVDDALTLTFKTPNSKPIDTTGVQIAVGGSKTIPVALFSDAPRGPIDVWAEEYPISGTVQQPDDLSFSVDKSSGDNGATIQLTINVDADHYGEGHEYFVVYAQSGDAQHRWPVVVGN
jgi:hypothetical protein